MNTFGIAASAEEYVEVHTEKELVEILKVCAKPFHILGGGSNLLLTNDLQGLVLKNQIKGIEIFEETEQHAIVSIGGGEEWHDLVLWALDNNLGGIENLSLIPGSVGAAPIQNIGAYGVELKDVFHQLEAIELATCKLYRFSKTDCRFGYRDSIFKNEKKGKYFISKVFLQLSKQPKVNTSYGAIKEVLIEKGIDRPTIRHVSEAVIQIRQSKLPDPEIIGNSGSFFKNPEITQTHFEKLRAKFPDIVFYNLDTGQVKVPAGWLIEKAGWKGKRMGDAGCHDKQALVLVNHGNASGKEIWNLALQIKRSVQEIFGIELAPEVNVW